MTGPLRGLFTGALCFLAASIAARAEPRTLALGDVAAIVKAQDLAVLEAAERVYQAREEIEFARKSLLPKLGLWSVVESAAGVVAGALSGAWLDAGGAATGLVGSVAPFLVPANWFRVSEAGILARAERESYRALVSNEILAAKISVLQLLMDRTLAREIIEERSRIESALDLAKIQALWGGATPEKVLRLESRILALDDDLRETARLIEDEKRAIRAGLGFGATDEIEIVDVPPLDVGALRPWEYDLFEVRAVTSSPEVRQLDRMLDVIPWIKKEARFAILGVSEASHGVAGGFFDQIPVQSGLGFAHAATLGVIESKKRELDLMRASATEVVRRQLKRTIDERASDLLALETARRREDLARAELSFLLDQVASGGPAIDPLAIEEASTALLQARIRGAELRFRILIGEERMNRVLFHADFSSSTNNKGGSI